MSILQANIFKAFRKSIALALPMAILTSSGAVQAQSPDVQQLLQKELVVATKVAPPFVMTQSDGTLYGISIDLWRRIAEQLHLRYHFSVQDTVESVLKGTEQGSFDAAIAALTATATRQRTV